MKEQDIIDLGFEKTFVSKEQSGDNTDFHYYTKEFDGVCVITNDNINAKEDGWEVYIFDYDLFTSSASVAKMLVDVLTKMEVK